MCGLIHVCFTHIALTLSLCFICSIILSGGLEVGGINGKVNGTMISSNTFMHNGFGITVYGSGVDSTFYYNNNVDSDGLTDSFLQSVSKVVPFFDPMDRASASAIEDPYVLTDGLKVFDGRNIP